MLSLKQILNKSHNTTSRQASRFIGMHHLKLLSILLFLNKCAKPQFSDCAERLNIFFEICNRKTLADISRTEKDQPYKEEHRILSPLQWENNEKTITTA